MCVLWDVYMWVQGPPEGLELELQMVVSHVV